MGGVLLYSKRGQQIIMWLAVARGWKLKGYGWEAPKQGESVERETHTRTHTHTLYKCPLFGPTLTFHTLCAKLHPSFPLSFFFSFRRVPYSISSSLIMSPSLPPLPHPLYEFSLPRLITESPNWSSPPFCPFFALPPSSPYCNVRYQPLSLTNTSTAALVFTTKTSIFTSLPLLQPSTGHHEDYKLYSLHPLTLSATGRVPTRPHVRHQSPGGPPYFMIVC